MLISIAVRLGLEEKEVNQKWKKDFQTGFWLS
jgi:hypothetical protein